MTFYALTNRTNQAELAYVVGVMLGDACIYQTTGVHYRTGKPSTTWCIDLNVTDREFAEAFAVALNAALRRPESRYAHVNERKPTKNRKTVYRVTMASRGFGLWWQTIRQDLTQLEPLVKTQPRMFLRGLYDSEGNLIRSNNSTGKRPYMKVVGSYVVRIFSQDLPTLQLAQAALTELGLTNKLWRFRTAGTIVQTPAGPYTAKELWCLRPTPARRFLEEVGSSIPRKAL